mmetsp:Transcript_6856/g.6158  ORF Transcript_6856/g.6158 Transcript_6856/m.6158 type:complete len:404 (+) Transcript_6856:89-1300(+)
MPSLSEKQKIIKEIDEILIAMILFNDDDSDDFKELMDVRMSILTTRYLNARNNIPKNDLDSVEMIWLYEDKEFKQIVRMDKQSFVSVVRLLENNVVFLNNSRNQQAPVWVQCIVAFHRFGCEGNGSSIFLNGHLFGISYGTVINYTERVIKALIDIRGTYIKWPNAEERIEISNRFKVKHGLLGAIGIVDGTPVHFHQRPKVDGEVFWTRKSRYSLNIQLICDDNGKILFYQVGWPGSVYDSTVFGRSIIASNPMNYFSNGQYILGDAGYTLLWYLCIPYIRPNSELPHNKVFNEYFSSARVRIEQVNAVWKNRFSSLKAVRIQIKKVEDFQRFNDWIVATLVLYNILHSLNDTWEDTTNYDDDENIDMLFTPVNNIVNEVPTNEAHVLRSTVQLNLLNWVYK